MTDLRVRFGRLLAAHRAQAKLTQDALAERAGLSVEMIGRIESGKTGARFPTIERLADALAIDPAQLFSTELQNGKLRSARLEEVIGRLVALDADDLDWIDELIRVGLRKKR